MIATARKNVQNLEYDFSAIRGKLDGISSDAISREEMKPSEDRVVMMAYTSQTPTLFDRAPAWSLNTGLGIFAEGREVTGHVSRQVQSRT